MTPGAPLGPDSGGHFLHADPRACDELGPRGIHHEPLAERGQTRNDVEGVEAEPGRLLTDDRGVDGDGPLDGHAVIISARRCALARYPRATVNAT
jgi:hypothetical protein